MYRIEYQKEAIRSLRRMPPKTAKTIMTKLEAVAADPYGKHSNVTKLQGREGYRLRVGDWRAIYEILDDRLIIHVLRVSARGSVYKE